mgnify:CR=1 FL=1
MLSILFKISFNIKDYKKTLYNGFLLHWIDNIEEPECLKKQKVPLECDIKKYLEMPQKSKKVASQYEKNLTNINKK